MLNELILLQILILVVSFFYLKAMAIIILWYIAGLILIFIGIILLLSNSDIFVGFLWVVDLGVGLIFFIFILHFSNFLHQKIIINLFEKVTLSSIGYLSVLIIFFFFFATNSGNFFNVITKISWFFNIGYYNYYDIINSNQITNLQSLREVYFYINCWEFFVVNYMLLYGIVSAVLLTFMLKKIFNSMLIAQFQLNPTVKTLETNYFIRQQNFVKQQNTSTGTRVWIKNTKKINDF